ncbi:hypothetical protein FRC15_010256 [Serendipita sp. 397]|nr:hypothetical protein FRC15_010256 [Serendipita sp. 397]
MNYFFDPQAFMSETTGLPIHEYSALPEETFCFDERPLPVHTSAMMEPSSINPNLLMHSQDTFLAPSSSQPIWTPSLARSRSVTPSEILDRLHDASSVFSSSPHAPSVYLDESFGTGSGSHTPAEPYPVGMSAAPGALLAHGNATLYDGNLGLGDFSVPHSYQTSPFHPYSALEAASSSRPAFHPQECMPIYNSSPMMTTQASNSMNNGMVPFGTVHVQPFVQHPPPQLAMPVAQPQLHQRLRHHKGSMSATMQSPLNPIDTVSPSISRHHRRFASAASVSIPSPLVVQPPMIFAPQNQVSRSEEHYLSASSEVSHVQHEYFTGMQVHSSRSSMSSSAPSRYSIAHPADVDESGSSAYSPYTPHTRNGSLSAPFSAITVTGMTAMGCSPTIAPAAIVRPTSVQSTTMGSESIVQTLAGRKNRASTDYTNEEEDEEEEDDSEDEYQLRHEEDEESADDEYVLPSGSDKRRRRNGNETSGRSTKRARGLSGGIISRHPNVGGKTLPQSSSMGYASSTGKPQSGTAGRDNNIKLDNLRPITKDTKKCPICGFSPSNGRFSDMKRHYDSHRSDGDKCKGIWVTAECGTFEECELTEEELATTWSNVEGLVDGRKKVVFTLNCSRDGCKTYTRKDSAKRHWKQSHANTQKEWTDDLVRIVHEVVRSSSSARA